jgi:hypothetical protein
MHLTISCPYCPGSWSYACFIANPVIPVKITMQPAPCPGSWAAACIANRP